MMCALTTEERNEVLKSIGLSLTSLRNHQSSKPDDERFEMWRHSEETLTAARNKLEACAAAA